MRTPETIAIIGATGKAGSGIARKLSKGNHRLILMSKDAQELEVLKNSLSAADAKALIYTNDCAREVSWEADIIMMAVPPEEEREVAEKIREVATGKIVISISDRPARSYRDLAALPGTSTAEELQRRLPDSKVVRTFSTTSVIGRALPATEGLKSDAFIAANNGNAIDVVSRLLASAGFNPVVVGDLSVCRALERMQLRLHIQE